MPYFDDLSVFNKSRHGICLVGVLHVHFSLMQLQMYMLSLPIIVTVITKKLIF